MPRKHAPLTDDQVKMFSGIAGKVLLRYLETLPISKIRKVQERWRRKRERVEGSGIIRILPPTKEHGIVRTGTGYVWR